MVTSDKCIAIAMTDGEDPTQGTRLTGGGWGFVLCRPTLSEDKDDDEHASAHCPYT